MSTLVSKSGLPFGGNCEMMFLITPMMSSDISELLTSLDRACRLVAERPSSACRLAEHWDNRSSGSV